jgi:hypothetical protein
VALEALRALSSSRSDENFQQLRTRLIERGYHDATDIIEFRKPEIDQTPAPRQLDDVDGTNADGGGPPQTTESTD